MKNILFAFSLLILLAASCSLERKEINAVLDRADSIMIAQPDSALHLLDSIAEEKNSFPRAQLMRYELLRADAQNKAYVDFTTDSVMKEVVEWYDSHGTPNEQMRANYLLGCTYRDLGDAPMELQCFLDATEKADTASADCDLYTLSAIYGQMANIYDNQYLPQKELKVLDKCMEIAYRDSDTLSALKAYELHIRPYYLLDNQDSILAITRKAHDRYLKYGYIEHAARMLSPAIRILIDRKQYDEAWEYMNFFDQNVNCNKNVRTYNKTVTINYNKGVLLLRKNDTESALRCFNELLAANKKEAAYHGLLLLYEKTHQPDSIAKYAKLFAEANDSSYIGTNAKIIAQMTAMYDYSRQEKIAKEKTIESANAKNTIYVISVISIIILFTLLALLTIVRYRNQEKLRIHREQEKYLLARYNETKDTIKKLEQGKEALKSDQAHIDQLMLTISRFEEEKQELESKLLEFNKITDDVDFKAWYEEFIDCNATKLLRTKTIVSPNHNVVIKEEIWDELRKRIKAYCPSFLTILDAYQLNPTYEKIVLLNTFDFSNGDISILFNKTTQQISNIHNRISKKMFPSSEETRKLKQNIQRILREKKP